jgi:hypothetical protein
MQATMILTSLVLLALGGCATGLKSMSSVKDAVILEGATEDIKVWVDGQPVEHRMVVASKNGANEILKGAIDLNPRAKSSYVVTVRQGGREATFTVHRKVATVWVVLDLLFTGGVGILVDWGTGFWNEFADKQIDVREELRTHGKPVALIGPAPTPVAPTPPP